MGNDQEKILIWDVKEFFQSTALKLNTKYS